MWDVQLCELNFINTGITSNNILIFLQKLRIYDSVYTIFEHRILLSKQTFKDPRNCRSSISKETAAPVKYDIVIKHEVLEIKYSSNTKKFSTYTKILESENLKIF